MSESVIDDEMEAMLREIETMGMQPDKTTTMSEVAELVVAEIDATSDAELAREMAEIEDAVATIEKKPEPKPKAPKAERDPVAKLEEKSPEEIAEQMAEIKAALIEAEAKKAAAVEARPTPTDPENVIPAAKPTPAPAARPASSTADILDPAQIKIDISINPADLDTALIQHPGLQMHYALKTADARRAYERMKSGVEILEAQLDSGYREKLSDSAGKKPTEAAIRNAVVGDPKYASAQTKLIDAQHLWKMCEAVESSFHSRKDILLEVARDRRKEKEGSLRILEDEGLRERVLAGLKK